VRIQHRKLYGATVLLAFFVLDRSLKMLALSWLAAGAAATMTAAGYLSSDKSRRTHHRRIMALTAAGHEAEVVVVGAPDGPLIA
jgi:hypothetical protein